LNVPTFVHALILICTYLCNSYNMNTVDLSWYGIAVVEIRVGYWLAVFLKRGHFVGYWLPSHWKYIRSKIGWPKWILVGQMLKLVRKWPQWPTVISTTYMCVVLYVINIGSSLLTCCMQWCLTIIDNAQQYAIICTQWVIFNRKVFTDFVVLKNNYPQILC